MFGISTLQVKPVKIAPVTDYSVQQEGLELDKFAQVMQLVQELSDGKPFRPEWLFNKELPEEVKLYLRSIFQQRIKGITSGIDTGQLSDEQLAEFAPSPDETLQSYSRRVTEFVNSVKSEGAQ